MTETSDVYVLDFASVHGRMETKYLYDYHAVSPACGTASSSHVSRADSVQQHFEEESTGECVRTKRRTGTRFVKSLDSKARRLLGVGILESRPLREKKKKKGQPHSSLKKGKDPEVHQKGKVQKGYRMSKAFQLGLLRKKFLGRRIGTVTVGNLGRLQWGIWDGGA
jgi:hypothetical protein